MDFGAGVGVDPHVHRQMIPAMREFHRYNDEQYLRALMCRQALTLWQTQQTISSCTKFSPSAICWNSPLDQGLPALIDGADNAAIRIGARAAA